MVCYRVQWLGQIVHTLYILYRVVLALAVEMLLLIQIIKSKVLFLFCLMHVKLACVLSKKHIQAS